MIETYVPFLIIGVTALLVIFQIVFFVTFKVKVHKNRIKLLKQKLDEDNTPKSGLWITCIHHGNISITLEDYNNQCKKFQMRCPRCHCIPTAIWKE